MGFRTRLRSDMIDVAATWRMLRHVREFTSGGDYSCSRYLHERAKYEPHNTAILFEDRRYTWREVDAEVNRYARYFESIGIRARDVVALLMDNRPEYIFVVAALSRLRAVSALINTNLTGAGLTHAINIAEPKAMVVGAEHFASVDEVVSTLHLDKSAIAVHVEDKRKKLKKGYVSLNQALEGKSKARLPNLVKPKGTERMCYIYTSGTTGLPKAAIITNRRWIAAAYLFSGSMMEATPRDVIYVALPLYHSSAMFAGWGSAVVSGAALALRRKFSASHFWSDVRAFDASIFLYIGELCRYLLNSKPSPHERSHRLRVVVGNGLRPDIWEKFQQRFAIPLVREFYGATEGNAPIANIEGRPGMVGRLRPGQVLVRCDEATGELLRNSEGRCEAIGVGEKGILLGRINKLMAFDGYVDKKATNKKVIENVFQPGDRYFNSGDLLELHPDGWVSFADRVGDTFRWKGENVSTNEVAEILNGAKGVLESNVYGVKVPGAEGRAGMGSINHNGDFDLSEFAAYVTKNLPSYQRPHFLRLQHDMRVTGTFKHQKVDYREEGFDPSKVSDPLYFLDGSQYVPIDDELFGKLQSGEVAPR